MMITRIIIFLLTLLLMPFFVLLAIIILLDDGYPFIFTQERVGINQSRFKIYKFRTMKRGMKDLPTHLLNEGSLQIINSGYFMRKFSLDELPQLFNIIIGNMTLIGPRPALHNQKDLIDLREKKGIHSLKPGLTGWAQVNGRDEISIVDKVNLDYYYLNNKSIFLDVKIFFLTIYKVLFIKDIS